jgi:hypothetical protein
MNNTSSVFVLTPEVYLEDSELTSVCEVKIKSQKKVGDSFITLGRPFFKAFLVMFDLTNEQP